MPQLDKATFFVQLFYFSGSFWILYSLLAKHYLPTLASALKWRLKLFNLLEQDLVITKEEDVSVFLEALSKTVFEDHVRLSNVNSENVSCAMFAIKNAHMFAENSELTDFAAMNMTIEEFAVTFYLVKEGDTNGAQIWNNWSLE